MIQNLVIILSHSLITPKMKSFLAQGSTVSYCRIRWHEGLHSCIDSHHKQCNQIWSRCKLIVKRTSTTWNAKRFTFYLPITCLINCLVQHYWVFYKTILIFSTFVFSIMFLICSNHLIDYLRQCLSGAFLTEHASVICKCHEEKVATIREELLRRSLKCLDLVLLLHISFSSLICT